MTTPSPLRYWYHPTADALGDSVEGFLATLGGPTLLHIPGRDRTRKRAVSTLLHGNEPSGTRAVYRWLRDQPTPAVDVLVFILSVSNALRVPAFSTRHLASEKDPNRCFREPFDGVQGELARAVLQQLETMQPEALIDIHNTSGMGPAFSVSMKQDAAHEALTSLFCERMLITGLRLGALFEYSERNVPTVTIECGGAQDPRSDDIAYEGLLRYVNAEDVLTPPAADWELDILHEPVRVEISADASICYREAMAADTDITLPPDVEHHNFGRITPEVALGWVRPDSWHKIRVKTARGTDVKHRLLQLQGNRLHPVRPLKLFMVTTNAAIAKSDCLFYAVTDDGSHLDGAD